MTKPTPVTTSTITQESGSSSIPQSATKRTTSPALVYIGPAGTHSNRIFWKTRCSGSAPSNCSTAPSAKTKDDNTLPTHSTLTALFFKRRPMSSIRAADASGNSGISQMYSRKNPVTLISAPNLERYPLSFSPLQQIHFVREHGLAVPEKRDDDSEAHGRLRGRVRYNENCEDLPCHVAEQTRKRHQVDIHRVQDQLDGHQHDNHVAPGHHADHTNQEQRQTQKQIVFNRKHRPLTPSSSP